MSIGRENLTVVNQEISRAVSITRPGQAHFAESSLGKTCGECKHFSNKININGTEWGRCKMAAIFSMKDIFRIPKIPHHSTACKYFEEK